MENNRVLILRTGIAGMCYTVKLKSEEGQKLIDSLQPGVPLLLRRESDNRYDAWAVAVYTDNGEKKLGYITRYKNESIARLLDDGYVLCAEVADREDHVTDKTPTEDSLIIINIYLSANGVADDSAYIIHENVDETLKRMIYHLISSASAVSDEVLAVVMGDIYDFAYALMASDGRYAWQEIEMLTLYLGKYCDENALEMLGRREEKPSLQFVLLIEDGVIDDHDLIDEYCECLEILGKRIIESDRFVTDEEQRYYDGYLKLLSPLTSSSVDEEAILDEVVEVKRLLAQMNDIYIGQGTFLEAVREKTDIMIEGGKADLFNKQSVCARRYEDIFGSDYLSSREVSGGEDTDSRKNGIDPTDEIVLSLVDDLAAECYKVIVFGGAV